MATWADLPRAARWFRIAHAAWAFASLAALAEIWRVALRGVREGESRRDAAGRHTRLAVSIGWLLLEGGLLVVGRGDCPAGPLQRRLGDPVPLFALVLPSRAAKAAVPVLAATSIAGILAALARLALARGVTGSRGRP